MTTKYKIQKQQLIELALKQQTAAADPKQSVWVEASAGTGKTKVLSDRVLRLLLSGVAPERILCLTYTKAAAVEMNERIARRLSLWAVETDNELEKELSSLLGNEFNPKDKPKLMDFARTLFAILLDTPGGMKIQTIHSFCQDILKRFPLEAGVSPYFEVLDDRSAKEILQEIKVELLKQADGEDKSDLDDAVSYLTQTVSEFSFPKIMNMITENRSKIAELLKKYNNDISSIQQVLRIKLKLEGITSVEELKQQAMSCIDRVEFDKVYDALLHGGKKDQNRAEALAAVKSGEFGALFYNTYHDVFFTAKGEILASLASKGAAAYYPEVLEAMQQEAERLAAVDNLCAAFNVFTSTMPVLHIAQNIISRYNIYKELYAVLDYEDLIIITRQLLENKETADWVLFKLDGGIEHILIDEAQDTSPNQWAIIRALTQEFFAGIGSFERELERTVFVVGDRKQSIYSFQGADPREFDKMCRYFSNTAQKFEKIHLDVSFRSTKAIMDCVNILFEAEEVKKGVVPDGEHINHLPFRLGEGGKVEIMPLVCMDTEQPKEEYNWKLPISRETKTSVSNLLARQIAQNIKKIVESGEILASKNRPIRYGDFMFLVQQRKSFVEEFVRACKDIGVNVAGVDKLKLLEQIAVLDLISLGRFLLLPTDDLSLAEVLKSPIFGLGDDDLFTLCYKRDGTLFSNLLKNPDYAETAGQLKKLLNMAGFARPFELFNYILVKLEGRKNFISRMGIEVEDVLDEFLNLAIIFEQKHVPTLENFINWIVQDEVIIQKEMEQGDNDTVKIMTVHGSKGLQAPIVILADTTKIKSKAQNSGFLWEEDGTFYFPTAASFYDANCKRIKQADLEADFEEYRRLLYVALTRAEDRLYIAGFTKDKEAKEESWYSLIKNNIKSNIELKENDERIVYEIEQENEFDEPYQHLKPIESAGDYSYLLAPAPVENPLDKPFAPSRDSNDEEDFAASPLEEKGNFYKRGTAIHKLLQYISAIPLNRQEDAAFSFLEKQLPDFSIIERQKIVHEVLKLCRTFDYIFTANSMAEIPVIGEADGKIISAKVDRLIIEKDKVVIVDYKTNRPAAKYLADVPTIYLRQLNAYKALFGRMYPDKEIITYILWTNTCNMMQV